VTLSVFELDVAPTSFHAAARESATAFVTDNESPLPKSRRATVAGVAPLFVIDVVVEVDRGELPVTIGITDPVADPNGDVLGK
jgi:hypothetical protein